MSSLFATLPANILVIPEPYKLEVPEEQIDKFRTLLRLSEVGPETWWSNPANGYYGITRQWLTKAKDEWLQFDWRKTERRINALPNFKMKIQSNGQPHDVHFAALFSARADAFPVILMHGWPGSFLEFLPFLELVSEKYSRNTLPWNIVVPSIPDYGLSVTQGQEAEMDMPSAAFIMNELMVQLGFKSGYAAQGGDVGSFLANAMAQMFPECIAFHLNMPSMGMMIMDNHIADLATAEEKMQMEKAAEWRKTGMAYALEHGTRPATVGLTVSSSPLAMLAWIGEKYLEWADERQPLSMETILSLISFYWFTKSYSTSLWPYRQIANGTGPPLDSPAGKAEGVAGCRDESRYKPLGYSSFPKELMVFPKGMLDQYFPNLVFYKRHDYGGHFAALEQPQAFLEDVEEFLQRVSKN